MTAVPDVAAATFGLAWGSFVGLLIDRVPRGEDVVRSRSRCDACGTVLRARDLVPVFSWLVLRGRCRVCGARVTARWTVVELSCAALAVVAWRAAAGDPSRAILVGSFLGILLALTLIDLDCRRLPNAIVYPATAVAAATIVVVALAGGPLDAIDAAIGAGSFGGCLFAIVALSRGGMGMGDVKLAGLIGLVIGSIDLGSVAVAAGAAVLLGGLAGMLALARGADRRSALPFGPMLAAGALVAVVAGRPIADAYLGLFA